VDDGALHCGAYAVPEEYIYSALEIPFDRRRPDNSLGEINREFQMGNSPNNNELVITISQNRDHRLPKKSGGDRPARCAAWMSIRYIANSSGVSEQAIFDAIGIRPQGTRISRSIYWARSSITPAGRRRSPTQ